MSPNASELISRYTVIAINTQDKVPAAKLWEKIKYIKQEEKKKVCQ